MKYSYPTHLIYRMVSFANVYYMQGLSLSFLCYGCVDHGSRLAFKWLAVNDRHICYTKVCNTFQLRREIV